MLAYQNLKKDMARWEQLSDEEKEEKEATLAQAERVARNDFTLASDYVNMLEYSTSLVRQSLFLPEMLGRMCGMLNYFLDQLAGSQVWRDLAWLYMCFFF